MKQWDSAFLPPPSGGRFRYVPFHQLSQRDQQLARSAYPHKGGGMYEFADEHYYYPVTRDGRMPHTRAHRQLAIPNALIHDDRYMASLGYRKNPGWEGRARHGDARGGLTVADIEQWIDNDEGLYDWWRRSRISKRAFIRENRQELEAAIRPVLEGHKPAHHLKYGYANATSAAASKKEGWYVIDRFGQNLKAALVAGPFATQREAERHRRSINIGEDCFVEYLRPRSHGNRRHGNLVSSIQAIRRPSSRPGRYDVVLVDNKGTEVGVLHRGLSEDQAIDIIKKRWKEQA